MVGCLVRVKKSDRRIVFSGFVDEPVKGGRRLVRAAAAPMQPRGGLRSRGVERWALVDLGV